MEKSATERSIFRRFAELSTLPITPDSVESRHPPEPDILCKVKGEGLIAFELVEIIDESLIKRTKAQTILHDLMVEYYEGLPESEKRILSSRIGDALICISFNQHISLKTKKGTVKDIFAQFNNMSIFYEGDVPLDGGIKTAIRRITIYRGVNGPCFDIEAVGSLGDPILERLKDKFSKSYKTNNSIELLVYYDFQPIRPNSHWMPKVTRYVKSNIRLSPFRRVWLFDVHNKRLLCWN